MSDLGKNQIARAIQSVVQSCKLQDRVHQSIGTLSKAFDNVLDLHKHSYMNLRLSFWTNRQLVWTPIKSLEIRELIQQLGKKHTILLSTHILSEVQSTCDRVIILHSGKKIADGLVQDIVLQTQAAP